MARQPPQVAVAAPRISGEINGGVGRKTEEDGRVETDQLVVGEDQDAHGRQASLCGVGWMGGLSRRGCCAEGKEYTVSLVR